MKIPSYNIGGRTAIIIEDLDKYGFDVVWSPSERTISAAIREMPTEMPAVEVKLGRTGKVAGNIYHTDINAYFNGMACESYNIGGRTAIVIEQLTEYRGRNPNFFEINEGLGVYDRNGLKLSIYDEYSVYLVRSEWKFSARTISLICFRPGFMMYFTSPYYPHNEIGVATVTGVFSFSGDIMYSSIDGSQGADVFINDGTTGKTTRESYEPISYYLDGNKSTASHTLKDNVLSIAGILTTKNRWWGQSLGTEVVVPSIDLIIYRNGKLLEFSGHAKDIPAVVIGSSLCLHEDIIDALMA